MSLGEKKKHTGVIISQTMGGTSKSSGKVTHLLDTGDGFPRPLRLKGGNAMHETSFDAFVGKRVTLEGVEGSGVPFIFVDKISDITVLGPPGRPRGPKPKL